jgi:hypothetical protein
VVALSIVAGCNAILGVNEDYEVGPLDGGGTTSTTGAGTGTASGAGTVTGTPGGTATGGGGTGGTGGPRGGAGGSGAAPVTHKRVFVTSHAEDGDFGGVAHADSLCQSVAAGESLGGTWRAWLSQSGSSAQSRLDHGTLPYQLLDGRQIAADWSDLTDGTLAHPIDVDETGTPVAGTWEVWTGTNPSGATNSYTCSGWQSATGEALAIIGLTNTADDGWTVQYQQFCDRTNVHFYCIEQ